MPTVVSRRAPRAPKLSSLAVRKLGDAMLEALDLSDAELSVLLTDDQRIQELNRSHRGKDKPTDVLAFPLDETEAATGGGPRLLGDVVISLDTAARQARGRRRPLQDEVRFLLAHGLLHLLGYDHDTPRKKKHMSARTVALVRHASAAARDRPTGPRSSARSARS